MKNFSLGQQQVILVIIFCLLIIFFFKYSTLSEFHFLPISKEVEERKPFPITLEIVGGVEKPGIYCFEHEVNLGEVIERAEGLKRNVLLTQEYFSLEVSNGAKISIGNTPPSFTMEVMEPEKRLLYFIPISINTASSEEFMVVPGIGEKTARAIIGHRQKRGPFVHLDELKEVSGIGNYNFKRMKKYLTL
jgi:competence protein ComEA